MKIDNYSNNSIFNSISIGIMCFNEVDTIESVVSRIVNYLDLRTQNYEVIVVNDGSSDGTTEVCDQLLLKYDKLRVITHSVNKGIGETLKSIHYNATKKWVVNIPADGQFSIENLNGIELSDNEFVSFFRKENLIYNTGRNYLSFMNKFINKTILGINVKDINWVKIYPTQFFKEHQVYLNSSLIESEIVYFMIQNNYKIIELPSEYLKREFGFSKGASFKVIKTAVLDLLKLIYVCIIKNNKTN